MLVVFPTTNRTFMISSSWRICPPNGATGGKALRKGLPKEPFPVSRDIRPGPRARSPAGGGAPSIRLRPYSRPSQTLPVLLEGENDVVMPFVVRGGMKLRLLFLQQIVDRVMDIGKRLVHVFNGGIRVFFHVRHRECLAGLLEVLPGRLEVLLLYDFFHLGKQSAELRECPLDIVGVGFHFSPFPEIKLVVQRAQFRVDGAHIGALWGDLEPRILFLFPGGFAKRTSIRSFHAASLARSSSVRDPPKDDLPREARGDPGGSPLRLSLSLPQLLHLPLEKVVPGIVPKGRLGVAKRHANRQVFFFQRQNFLLEGLPPFLVPH